MHNLNNVLEYIETLSVSDQKSLTAKTLKAAEELGELAQVVLPYEGSYATTHRFTDRTKILEESCDLMLCALSVPFSMGYTIDDITEMMKTKADKWAGLQAASNKGKYPLPFEIHITVKTDDIDKFVAECKTIDVKPIVLDLQTNLATFQDIMTSSVIITDNTGAYNEMMRISDELYRAGFDIIREKIETVPYHPAAPSIEFGDTGHEGYFECHFNLIIRTEQDKVDAYNISEQFGCHLSKNKFKVKPGYYTQMMTFRKSDITREVFGDKINTIKGILQSTQIEVQKVITEYAIYDTKVSHDLAWITGS